MLKAIGRVKLGTRAGIRKLWFTPSQNVGELYFDSVQRVSGIQMIPGKSWYEIDLSVESCELSQRLLRQNGSTKTEQTVIFYPGSMNPITRNAVWKMAKECSLHLLAKLDDGQFLYLGVSFLARNESWHTEQMKLSLGSGDASRDRERAANEYSFSLNCVCDFMAPFYIGGVGILPIIKEDPVVSGDLFPPVIASKNPLDGANQVPTTPTLSAVFNRNVQLVSGTISLRKYSDDSLVFSWDVANPSEVALAAPDTIQMSNFPALDLGVRYYVEIPASGIKSIEGISFAGTAKDDWDFTTQSPPPLAPTLDLLSPLDNSVGFDPTTELLEMTFNMSVKAGIGFFKLHRYSDDSLVASIAVLSTRVTFNGTSTLTIDVSTLLQPSTEFYVLIDAGAVENMAGIPWAGSFASKDDWNFTASNFGTPPSVLTYLPAQGASSQSQAPTIRITFSEPLTPDSGEISLIQGVDFNGPFPVGLDGVIHTWNVALGTGMTWSGGNTILELSGHPVLVAGASFYITWPNSAFVDSEGLYVPKLNIPADGAPVWSWTVAPAQSLLYFPVDGSTAANNSFDPYMRSDQPQKLTDGTDKYIRVYDYDTDVLIKTIKIPGSNPPAQGDSYRFTGEYLYFERLPVTSSNHVYILMEEGVFQNAVTGVLSPAFGDKNDWNFTYAADAAAPFFAGANPFPGQEIDPTIEQYFFFLTNKWTERNGAGKRLWIHKSDGACVVELRTEDPTFFKQLNSQTGSSFWTAFFPPNTFEIEEEYFIRIEAGSFIDKSGNLFVGLTDNTWWFKTTGSTAIDNSGFAAPSGQPYA